MQSWILHAALLSMCYLWCNMICLSIFLSMKGKDWVSLISVSPSHSVAHSAYHRKHSISVWLSEWVGNQNRLRVLVFLAMWLFKHLSSVYHLWMIHKRYQWGSGWITNPSSQQGNHVADGESYTLFLYVPGMLLDTAVYQNGYLV